MGRTDRVHKGDDPMAGICGCYNRRSTEVAGHHRMILAEMSSAMGTDASTQTIELAHGAVCGAELACDMAVDTESGVCAVITGRPTLGVDVTGSADRLEGIADKVLQAYRRSGERFLETLHGTFAVVLVDPMANKLILAIDRLGVESLCFALGQSESVSFGSRADCVAKHPLVDSSLSPDAIFRYIYFHVIPSPSTIYSNVSKLEPAQVVVITEGDVDARSYWVPEVPGAYDADDDAIISRLREETHEAVTRSIGNGQLGAFLSGGLDSSTVAGLANEHVDAPLPAYTIGFDQDGFDEMEFAKEAAKRFGLEHRPYYVTALDIAETFEKISTYFDEPFGNSSVIPAYFCASNAKRDGVTCLLAGDGGDELFGGNERYALQTLFNYYHLVPKWARKHVIEPAMQRLPTDWSTLSRKARRYVEQASLPMPKRLQTYNFVEMHGARTIFQQSFLENVDLAGPSRDLLAAYERGKDFDFLQQMLILDWKLTLADNDLRKVGKMCEAAGISVRYPLLDERLVSYSVQIPSRLKLKGRELRFVFKEAFSDYLPKKILTKEKHGFGLPFGDWLKTSRPLQEVINPCIERMRGRDIFEQAFIDDMLARHQTVHSGFYGNMLWILAVLDSWLARYHD